MRLFARGIGALLVTLSPALLRAAEAAPSGSEKLRGFGLADSGAVSPPLGRVLLVFMLVAGLAWVAVWLLRRYGFKLPGSAIPATTAGVTPIRHLSRSVLPGGVACHVVEAQGREVLITVTRNGVDTLVLGDARRPDSPEPS